MVETENDKIKQKHYTKEWKNRNQEYLRALDKFFDIVDNVGDERLKLDIIYQMLKCDEILTKLAENKLSEGV